MRDIDPLPSYSQGNEAEFRKEIVQDIGGCYRQDRDLFVDMNQRLCVQSPNGTWWRLELSDAGVITPVSVTP